MNNTKSPFKSLTVIVSVLGILLSLFGIDLSPEDQAMIAANLDNIASSVMFVLAIFGRFRATTKLTL